MNKCYSQLKALYFLSSFFITIFFIIIDILSIFEEIAHVEIFYS